MNISKNDTVDIKVNKKDYCKKREHKKKEQILKGIIVNVVQFVRTNITIINIIIVQSKAVQVEFLLSYLINMIAT